jgi:hypothetical protein
VRDVVDDEHLHRVVAPRRDVLPHGARPRAGHGKADAEQYAGYRRQYLAGAGPSLRPFRGVTNVRAEIGRDIAHLTSQGIQPSLRLLVQLLPGKPAMTPRRMPSARNHLVDVP